MANGIYIQLYSIHGLVRGRAPELGADADTGGQVLYVLHMAGALARHPAVERVELVTRLIRDPAVSPDYAVPVEPLSDKAAIVRIPCGPDRYLRKEELWPHVDEFVQNAASHLRSTRKLPDLIHSHYADAGAVCRRLSGLFGVPQVHSGHSLGRLKRQRLLAAGDDQADVDARFHFERRIDEEERTFENAALIIASTHQERREQYGLYDTDVSGKIQVIPPGVDVDLFFAYFEGRSPEVIRRMNQEFGRFLKDNDKPPILAISRPDRTKNLGSLVTAYGESPELQDLANLVIFAGVRHDISEMPDNEREVLTDLLIQMDKYDLYGKMALPKTHEFETDVPALYRMAARKGGIFVNPCLHEQFGLTLIEAAASGLPIVATNSGGPPDIVGACRNGIVVPPTDTKGLARAMLRILADPAIWHSMSESGIRGVRANYTWDAHADAYIAAVDQVLGRGEVAVTTADPRPRKLVICDVDDVLTGDPQATERLAAWLLAHSDEVSFVMTTGRTVGSVRKLLDRGSLPAPDWLVASAGTELYYMPGFRLVQEWEAAFRDWDRARIRRAVDLIPALLPQEASAQSRFKLSFYVGTEDNGAVRTEIESRLAPTGCRVRAVFSNENLLDLVPALASKGRAVASIIAARGLQARDVLVCGDSADDMDMLTLPALAVVPAYHRAEVAALEGREDIYFAASSHADAIIEAVAHYGFLAGGPPASRGTDKEVGAGHGA